MGKNKGIRSDPFLWSDQNFNQYNVSPPVDEVKRNTVDV